MAENEDSTLLLNTICTDKIPSFVAVGSPDFEAMAASTFGRDWREGKDALHIESITETIQGQLILDHIREMPEEEARRQLAVFGWDCRFKFISTVPWSLC